MAKFPWYLKQQGYEVETKQVLFKPIDKPYTWERDKSSIVFILKFSKIYFYWRCLKVIHGVLWNTLIVPTVKYNWKKLINVFHNKR